MNGTSPHSKPGIARRMLARLRLLRMKCFRGKPAPVWFAEFDDGRLDLVEDGKTTLSVPLADIVAVGESTNADGPWSDDHFLVVRYREAGEEKELELPFNERSGVGDSCTGLLRALGAPPVLPLLNCTHPASVFLWPPDKAGSPVWPDYGPTHSVGSGRDFARWRREHAPAVLRRRMPASRTLLCLVCLGISLLTFVLVLAGTALSTGPTRILCAWFPIGLVWGLPALFVLSRFAVIEIARTPQHGYRRRVLLCGVPLSVRTVPEGRLVRVQEAGTGGWHGVSGISPSARLCVARADGHHLLLGQFPCLLFGLDALPEAAFAPLGADDPDARPAVDGAPPAWVEETLPPHTGTKRGERRREAVVRARAEVLTGLEPDDALALRAGNAFVRMFAFLPFVAGIVALVIVGCLRPVPSWSFLLLLAAFASGIAWFTTGSRKVLCPRCGSPAVSVRTFENGTRRYWLVCNECRIYAPGDNAGSGAARATVPAPRTIKTMNADELAAFHARRDEENRKARGALSYEEWFAERERLAAFLARRGVRGFEHGGLDPSAKRSWRERLHLLSGRLRRGRAFRGDFGLSDDWFENRLFGLQLLSSRMFRSGLLSAIRRHLGSPDNGFAVSIATDFPIVTETVVTARECVTDFAGDAVRKAETLARTDPAARRQLRDLRRLLGGPRN